MLAAIFMAGVSPAREETPKAPPPRIKRLSSAEIERLIDRLGSADYRERESATETLKQRPEALPLLQASLKTSNPEVKRRLETIVSAVMRREAAKRLDRLPEYVKHRQLDRLVETMVAWREYITTEHDAQVRAFVKDIYTEVRRGNNFPPTPWLPPAPADLADFTTFAWHNRLGVSSSNPTIVDRITPGLNGLGGGGLIASDGIVSKLGMQKCIALCNGDVKSGSIYTSIIISNGSIFIRGDAHNVVLVCLGDVITHSGGNAVVVAAGKITSSGEPGWDDEKVSIIRQRDTAFFSTWKLYSANEAGAMLWSLFGVVGIGAVAPDSRFARVGIRPGDILTRIDGIPIRSIRDANRLLCRATVSSGVTDLTIIRDVQCREVVVTLQEW